MDKKEARKILGVTKETSRNDIERKYSILLKKHRAASLPPEPVYDDADGAGTAENGSPQTAANSVPKETVAEEYTFDQVTEAYNILMGYEVVVKEQPPSKAAPLLQKAGIDEKKARNFFYYYKFHILGALVLAIALFFGIRSFVNRVEPDFNIAFLGEFSYLDAVDKLSDSIKKDIPEIKEPGIDGAYLTPADVPDNQQASGNQQQTTENQQTSSDNQQQSTGTQQQPIMGQANGDQQYAMQMKAMVLVAAGDLDVLIVDKDRYFLYAKQGVFMNLDEIAPKLGADLEKNKELVAKIDEDSDPSAQGGTNNNQAHLYGIDVSGSTALNEAGVLGPDKIAGIYVSSKNKEKAEKFIKFLMK
ncbi:MAG TPA: hypothetical protein VHT96_09555 [Clostridia bacterium]|nr:hypothetical protein [Clostridia bacterium]